jgi:predicted anti-sigma-YlaC factor YlaD
MHRLVRDHIEDAVAGVEAAPVAQHLKVCEECRNDVMAMRAQSAALRELRAPDDAEPRPGFYARVMERIEAQGPASIWNLFIESAFGRRIAVASLALALLLGVYVISSERATEQPLVAGQPAQPAVVLGEDAPGRVISQMDQSSMGQSSDDAVLVNLVTYQEQ